MARAKPGDKVRIHYTGSLADGSVFDSSVDASPFEFTLGQQGIIPALGHAVEGMSPGDKKTLHVPAADGFGLRNEGLVHEVDRAFLPDDVVPKVGMHLRATSPGDKKAVVTILELRKTTALLDGNHPLAGKDLTFEIVLVEFA